MPRAKPVAAGAQHLTKAEKEKRLEREKDESRKNFTKNKYKL